MALPRKPKFTPQAEPQTEVQPVAPTEPQAEVAVEPVAPPPPKTIKLLATGWGLLEPHEQIWFHAGKPREVYRITRWMQAQIDAGLLKFV